MSGSLFDIWAILGVAYPANILPPNNKILTFTGTIGDRSPMSGTIGDRSPLTGSIKDRSPFTGSI